MWQGQIGHIAIDRQLTAKRADGGRFADPHRTEQDNAGALDKAIASGFRDDDWSPIRRVHPTTRRAHGRGSRCHLQAALAAPLRLPSALRRRTGCPAGLPACARGRRFRDIALSARTRQFIHQRRCRLLAQAAGAGSVTVIARLLSIAAAFWYARERSCRKVPASN